MVSLLLIFLNSISLNATTRAPRDGTLELCDVNSCKESTSPIIIVESCVMCDLSPILIALSTLESPTCVSCTGTAITQQALDDAGGTYTIDTPGRYTLAETLFASDPDGTPVITIKSSDVTLDCCNNGIVCSDSGNSRTGIFIEGSLTNITITNGVIVGAGVSGIQGASGIESAAIKNMTIAFSGKTGIEFSQCRNLIFEYCLVAQSGTSGATLQECSEFVINSSFFGESIQKNLTGLLLIGCTLGTVSQSEFSDNQADEITYGCLIQKCEDLAFLNCAASGNLTSRDGGSIARGFEVDDSIRIVFDGCSVINLQGATAYGLYARKSQEISWKNGFCTNFSGQSTGIFFESSDQNSVENSLVTHMIADGERVARAYHSRSSTNNTFISCMAVATQATRTSSAFEVEGGIQGSIRNCIALNAPTTAQAIECDGYTFTKDGGGNASKNGLIEQSAAIGYTGIKLGFGYRDTTSPSSTLCTTNRAFNCAIPFNFTYSFGGIPVGSFTLGGSLPSIGSIGSLDNFSLVP